MAGGSRADRALDVSGNDVRGRRGPPDPPQGGAIKAQGVITVVRNVCRERPRGVV